MAGTNGQLAKLFSDGANAGNQTRVITEGNFIGIIFQCNTDDKYKKDGNVGTTHAACRRNETVMIGKQKMNIAGYVSEK